ncbi:MAG TPA: prolyl oligopeptidase family serine peptidase [Terriglobales bacterium]|jgi:dipeptidyl aminopeptidase/acylaminoacyl peptidase|nr:prolyl oligopeptidase family serine peptidase [Terriglobales bacterium]
MSSLVQHGKRDTVVPVEEAIRVQSVLQRLNVPCRLRLYPDVGHYFGEKEMGQVITETLGFFNEWLK